MREIEFKAKRKDNGEWIFGYYCYIGYTNEQKHLIVPTYASVFYEIEVFSETVSQYTGLKDKNGTKIFEGDIIELEYFGRRHIGKVVFNDKTCGFEVWHNSIVGAYGEKATLKKTFCTVEKIKITGNIFDNKELLNETT